MIELGVRSHLRRDVGDESASPSRCNRSVSSVLDLVRTAHLMPEFEQKRGDPAHSAAGDTDEMNRGAARCVRIFCRSSSGARRHDRIAYIFPSSSTTSAAAFFGASREEFSDMRWSLVGSLDQVLGSFARASRRTVPIPSEESPPRARTKISALRVW